jgi:hypothetical protein
MSADTLVMIMFVSQIVGGLTFTACMISMIIKERRS